MLVRNADAEVLQFPGESFVQLLADADATGGAMSVHRTRLRDGANGAEPHHHTMSSEMFYVIDGSLDVLIGDEVFRARVGDLVLVPPDITHAFAAAPGCDAEVLVLITPGVERFGFFRRLSRIVSKLESPGSFFASQAAYDTYPDDSAAWRIARPSMSLA